VTGRGGRPCSGRRAAFFNAFSISTLNRPFHNVRLPRQARQRPKRPARRYITRDKVLGAPSKEKTRSARHGRRSR